MDKKWCITNEAVLALIEYLKKKPYDEVAMLFSILDKEMTRIDSDNDEEIDNVIQQRTRKQKISK